MRSLLLFSALVLACTGMAQTNMAAQKSEVVFRSVNVIPMDSDRVVPNQTVVVHNGKIAAMGEAGKVTWSKAAFVVDGTGKYLMPGLAEMHAHVPPVADLKPMQEVLLLFLTQGITTIRGMLGHPKHLELRRKLRSGEILGPHFITSGPSFNGNSVKTVADAARMVREQKQAGYDFLKLHPGLTKETFPAVAKTAHEVGIPFAGHVSFGVGVWQAIDSGYATIDHLDGFVESLVPGIETITEQEAGLFAMYIADRADTSRIPALMQRLREKQVWVVPTQALAERWFAPMDAAVLRNEPEMKYMDAGTLNNWVQAKQNLMSNPKYDAVAMNRYILLRRQLILACARNGVGLLLGSDAPQVFDVPGFSAHHELRYLVEAGLTPYEALRTGTVQVAQFLNRTDAGIIKQGAAADLILLNGNPLVDINQSKNIAGVVLAGRWLPKSWIDQTLKSLEKN
jgi:imidazolonepropionase-like amidohydrolase